MPKIADRVKETTTSTGTGTINLGGAATGYRAFSSAFVTTDVVYYCIEDGTSWEVGYGTLTTGTPWTLSRTLLASSTGALINWGAGTKNVFCTVPAVAIAGVGVNAVINGGMIVAQRADLTLGSSAPAANAGYGKVDRFQAWCTGTAVSAGTATQDTAATIGRTGYALKLSGVTLTGTGIAYVRHRIEANNSVRFKNQVASLSAVVKHDVGSAINYTLTVRKANTADTFSATTVIQTGSATSVASATETTIKLENISMGDCSNGIEIEVKAECGAITTKNFWLTELQLEPGVTATTFEHVDFGGELVRCWRYFEKSFDYATAPADSVAYENGRGTCAGVNVGASYTYGYQSFFVEKRAIPTLVLYPTAYGSGTPGQWRSWVAGSIADSAPTTNRTSRQKLYAYLSIAGSSGQAGEVYGHWIASSEL